MKRRLPAILPLLRHLVTDVLKDVFKGVLMRASWSFLIAPLLVASGCAYRMGSADRILPAGYHQVSIPIFKNKTQEVGIEVAFTNALIQEVERTKSGRVVEPAQAEVQVEGEITTLQYIAGSLNEKGLLPSGSVLASQYRILATTHLKLVRISDRSVLWESHFSGERTYVAPQVNQQGLNTVNPLYNLAARRQNISIMASDMMSEAHDRMTENF